MANNTVIEWLQENSYRAYPLQEGSANVVQLGNHTIDVYALIVDANLAFANLPSTVTLDKIVLTSGSISLYVSNQTVFTTSYASENNYYVRNSYGSLLVLNGAVLNRLTGSGFVKLSNIEFEPSVCYETGGVYEGVSSIDFTGGISAQNWTNGYQFSVVPTGQTIQLEVGRNTGVILPCGDYLSAELSDKLLCGQVLHSINGATPTTNGGTIKIEAGEHVKIFNDPQRNAIYIGLDFVANDIGPATILPV